jgi:hypothetical protein
MRERVSPITKATGRTITSVKTTSIGVIVACPAYTIWIKKTKAERTKATKNVNQNSLRFPILGSVLETVVIIMPAKAGPHVATETSGKRSSFPFFIKPPYENPNPHVMRKVNKKKVAI